MAILNHMGIQFPTCDSPEISYTLEHVSYQPPQSEFAVFELEIERS